MRLLTSTHPDSAGFPWIDALMRQLKETGWIHHLGRHSVAWCVAAASGSDRASFLTRGHCYISWERGEGPSELPEHPLTLTEVFARHLVDWNSVRAPCLSTHLTQRRP